MSHDNDAHNLDLNNEWNDKMRREEQAEQDQEDSRLAMQYRRHRYQASPVVGFCLVCGINQNVHGKDFPQ
jgi:hypothetical protein